MHWLGIPLKKVCDFYRFSSLHLWRTCVTSTQVKPAFGHYFLDLRKEDMSSLVGYIVWLNDLNNSLYNRQLIDSSLSTGFSPGCSNAKLAKIFMNRLLGSSFMLRMESLFGLYAGTLLSVGLNPTLLPLPLHCVGTAQGCQILIF